MTDIDDAEAMVRNHQGIENDELGRLLVRMVREARALRVAVKDLRDRMAVLEAPPAVPATPDPAPAEPALPGEPEPTP
jgi:hypothetical protein